MDKKIPLSPGVYIHKDVYGKIIYVGKAKNLRKRVASYFNKKDHDAKTELLVKNIHDTEFIVTNNELEALLLEDKLIKKHKPKFNIDLKESYRYPYLKITNEEFPKISVARKTNSKDMFFGPFTTSIRELIKILRELFKIHNCKPSRGKPCLYYSMDLCAGRCVGKITSQKYKKLVFSGIKKILDNPDKLIKKYREEMRRHSQLLEFEKAQILKERIKLLEQIKQKQNFEDPVLLELKELLLLKVTPTTIDCFDISNFGTSVIVGACVQFKNKVPNKSAYRLYNIKGNFGQDDFRSIHEVVKRRYSSLPLPDLILIDGGIIQVNFALKALRELNLSEASVVGLAKKEETIVLPSGEQIKLNRKNESSKLLINIRDATHNFAITHSRNRFKKVYKSSELDKITGIGESTKFKLLNVFGTVDKIKKAQIQELAEVIGTARAKLIFRYFHE